MITIYWILLMPETLSVSKVLGNLPASVFNLITFLLMFNAGMLYES